MIRDLYVMNFLVFLFFCKIFISLESEQVEDSSFLFQNDLQTSELSASLDNPYDIFSSASAGSDDSSVLAFSSVPLISDDFPVSSDLFDLSNSPEEDQDLLFNDISQSPDLFAPIGSDDSGLLLEPSVSGTGVETGDVQDLALLDDLPKPLINPFDIIRGIYDGIQNLDILQDSSPDESKPARVPDCGPGYFPFCCLKGPPRPVQFPENGDRRAKCYTCEVFPIRS